MIGIVNTLTPTQISAMQGQAKIIEKSIISQVMVGLFVFSATLLLSGCAKNTFASRMPDRQDPEYPHVVEVIVQVCVPNQDVHFEDTSIDLSDVPKVMAMEDSRGEHGWFVTPNHRSRSVASIDIQGDMDTVRRWIPASGPQALKNYGIGYGETLNSDGIFSDGGMSIYLIGSTENNQPVFENASQKREQDFIALRTWMDVVKDGRQDRISYWFKLPKNIPIGQFSNWQEPISQEDKATNESQRYPTAWRLFHGKEMQIYKVEENAPKMRFKLMKIMDYYDENRFWKRAQQALGKKYYMNLTKEEREKIFFVPKRNEKIPGC